jgi:hypothetical protein
VNLRGPVGLLVTALVLSAAVAVAQPVTGVAPQDAGVDASPFPGPPLVLAPTASASVRAAGVDTKTAANMGRTDITESLACSACHTTTAWKTRLATTDEDGFDHAKTGFPLTGVHGHTPCASCHIPDRPTPKRDCNSCHTDWHRGKLGASCDRCHSAVSWKATQPVEVHRMTRFPLTGMHVLADCTQCHQRANEHVWTGVPLDCFACHESDYKQPTMRPLHQGSATLAAFPRDCNQCHRSFSWAPAFVPAGLTGVVRGGLSTFEAPPNHDLRFPISYGVHRTAQCSDCHTSQVTPRAVQCVGCHAHAPVTITLQHKQPVAKSGSACLACHVGGAKR